MVLYGITLAPLTEELQDADPTLLSPFYANDAVFYGSARQSAAQLRLLMDQGADQGYFPKPSKSLFIADNRDEKEAANREFEQAVLNINCVYGGHYLGGYLGPREDLEERVCHKVEAWAHGVIILAKIEKRRPHFSYAGLGMLLQTE